VHIANILSNLIENAIKYSGPEVNIRVVVIRNDRLIELTVTDNGVGISADEQTKVFEKFYRSTRLPDKQIPGLGLGLSYVRQIAEAHHGQVSLRSEVGKGTEVTVGLPI
jgi:two-component system phosphate regulon sensor histidine kinase PhoR